MSAKQCFGGDLLVISTVRFDDILHQSVANYVLAVEVNEVQALYPRESTFGVGKPADRSVGQVGLAPVAGYYHLRPGAHTCKEHKHLRGCGVLGFVENDH